LKGQIVSGQTKRLRRGAFYVASRSGQYLIIERSDGRGWCFPGGLSRPGEAPEATVRRCPGELLSSVRRIYRLLMKRSSKPFVVGIGGGTGAGKTTITHMICSWYKDPGVCLLDQDSYYRDRSGLSLEERQAINYDHPSAFDHDLLACQMERLIQGVRIEKPRYCFSTHTRSTSVDEVHPAPIIVLEGILVLWDARVRSMMDLKIYVEADADLRFIRRLRRDVTERGRTMESVVTQYLESVRPMHQQYIEPTKAHADMVINNASSLSALAATIEARLKGQNLT
jgi:uridine kinase